MNVNELPNEQRLDLSFGLNKEVNDITFLEIQTIKT